MDTPDFSLTDAQCRTIATLLRRNGRGELLERDGLPVFVFETETEAFASLILPDGRETRVDFED